MADRKKWFALLSVLLMAMPGMARAATFTVTNTLDSGMGSLRDAITSANTVPTVASRIDFNVNGTITLLSALPAIANTSPGSLTIDGSGQAITVDGANSFRILSVNPGATLIVKFLAFAHGSIGGNEGGAILNSGTLTVMNDTFSNNLAGSGGAISNVRTATATVSNGTFSENQAVGGGAIRNQGTMTVSNSTFSENQSSPAGGFFFAGGAILNDGGTLTVTNSTFSGNQASGTSGGGGLGGAIANEMSVNTQTPGTLMVTNSTFSGNHAFASGGAIGSVFSTATVKSSVMAGSTGGNCAGSATPAVTDAGYNIADDNSCGFSGTSVNNITTLHLDPAGLADNGGPTQTIAIEGNSEAFDFIPVADCTDQSTPTPIALMTDQRGLPRPDFGNPNFCDAGAFELQAMPFAIAPNSERVQIARSTAPNSDQVNMAFTFIENGIPACDAADNAFNGVTVVLEHGTCATLDNAAIVLDLSPWVVHTVNHASYGTFFGTDGPMTISARMVELPTPAAPACGEWTINIEVAGADTAGFGNGPFALILSNPDGDQGCFDITNAIVGGQLPSPPHTVRRGVRR